MTLHHRQSQPEFFCCWVMAAISLLTLAVKCLSLEWWACITCRIHRSVDTELLCCWVRWSHQMCLATARQRLVFLRKVETVAVVHKVLTKQGTSKNQWAQSHVLSNQNWNKKICSLPRVTQEQVYRATAETQWRLNPRPILTKLSNSNWKPGIFEVPGHLAQNLSQAAIQEVRSRKSQCPPKPGWSPNCK